MKNLTTVPWGDHFQQNGRVRRSNAGKVLEKYTVQYEFGKESQKTLFLFVKCASRFNFKGTMH